jgi:DNA-binding LacI/PurR family transcriptional regulator
VAIGGLKGCRLRNVTVPDDVSIAGYDDIELAKYVTPSLTTIQQPREKMGQLATQLILSLLQGESGHSYKLPPILVKRESTGRPSE